MASLASLKETIERGGRIKLLGDSITHGVGGDGFKQDGEHIVNEFSRNPNGYCWANLLRDSLASKYGCTVINNACTGTKIEFIIEHFDTLVSDTDDCVICTIGTNNRHQYFHTGAKRERGEMLDTFYNNILRLNGMFKEKGVAVVFAANIPASRKNELDGEDYWRILHMDDINNLYKKASAAQGFELISIYDLALDYMAKNGCGIDDILCDGLHPNNKGHEMIFELLCNEIGA